MKKYIQNLEEKVSSILNESLVADAAELVGIDEQDAEDRIKGLSFANYLELGNAVDLEDAETAREILGTVAPVEETSGTGGTGAGAVGGGDIGTWDGKAHKKPKAGLKNSGKGIYEDGSGELYHVTHTKYIPAIQKNGLRPMGAPSNWVQQGSGERYGMGEIYLFTSREDAKQWAGRMDWDFNHTLGSGEISIITLRYPKGQELEKDEADPMSQAGQKGDWLKAYEPISPENIIKVDAYNPKMESVNEEDTECDLKLLDQPTMTVSEIADKHDVPMSDIASELAMGIKVELEHTKDRKIAKEIALDHLMELPDYYTRLKKMEESGRPASNAKNYVRKGGNDEQYKWQVTLNNGKTKTVWADSRKTVKDGLGTNDLIIGIKSAKKLDEADNPYASAPSQGSSVDALAKQAQATPTAADKNKPNELEQQQRKSVDDLSVGDDIEVIDIDGDPTPVTVKTPRGPGDTLVVQTKKGEEHIVKKQAVSGTPTIQEMYENALGEMKADDFEDAVKGTPLYVAVFQVTKVPSWAEGKVNKGDLVYWNDRSSTLVRVSGGAIGLTATAVSFVGHFKLRDVLDGKIGDEEPLEEVAPPGMEDWIKARKPEFKKRYGDRWEEVLYATAWKRKNNESIEEDKDRFVGSLIGMPDLDRYWVYINRPDVPYVMYHIPRSQAKEGEPRFLIVDKETGDWQTQFTKRNDEEPVEKGYGTGPHTVKEARNATNTEHSGAKKGKGGYYGRKKDAKSDSNKKRRANDKKAVSEGAVKRAMEDDAYTLSRDEWLAKYGEEWAEFYDNINELDEDLANHVNVEYRDPEGRFIVVHAAPAGYWAVGKGQYQHDVDRTAFDNFDDALDHAHQCLASLDEGFDLSEIRRLAGLKEAVDQFDTDTGDMFADIAPKRKVVEITREVLEKNGIDWRGVTKWSSIGKDVKGYIGSDGRKHVDYPEFADKASPEQVKNVTSELKKVLPYAEIDMDEWGLSVITETASAGATGAGAIATAPTAMGSDPIRRSIYDKPTPKKRTKESDDDGLGRVKKK